MTPLPLLVLVATTAGAAQPLVIGVAEHPQCNDEPGTAVRALFVSQAHGWVALSSPESSEAVSLANVTWTVAFEGGSLGSVRTVNPGFQTPHAWTYPRDRLLLLASGQSVPTIANEDKDFAGWCDAPLHRPLVLVTRPNFRDPDRWKPLRPDGALRGVLFPAFKAQAGEPSICLQGTNQPVPLAFAAKDLVFSKSYQDRAGRKLVVVGLDPQRNTCDGPPDAAWARHMFLLDTRVHYLGSHLSVVDAGDYDGDGESEILFWYSGYNEDGYTLLYQGLRKRVDYHWKYH